MEPLIKLYQDAHRNVYELIKSYKPYNVDNVEYYPKILGFDSLNEIKISSIDKNSKLSFFTGNGTKEFLLRNSILSYIEGLLGFGEKVGPDFVIALSSSENKIISVFSANYAPGFYYIHVESSYQYFVNENKIFAKYFIDLFREIGNSFSVKGIVFRDSTSNDEIWKDLGLSSSEGVFNLNRNELEYKISI